jgi:hypothetical protein
MTNQQHPITPPAELVQQWILDKQLGEFYSELNDPEQYFATQAAQWGADQELEACCEWFQEFYKTESWVKHDLKHFRDARRPKPPSLKAQALADLDTLVGRGRSSDTIRRALEQLPDQATSENV